MTVEDVIDNADVFTDSACEDEPRNLRWQVYNTATKTDFACGYTPPSNTPPSTQTFNCTTYIYRLNVYGGNLFYESAGGAQDQNPDQIVLAGHYCDTCYNTFVSNNPNATIISQTGGGSPGSPISTVGTGVNAVNVYQVDCVITYTQSSPTSNAVPIFTDCYSNVFYRWNGNYYNDFAHTSPTTLEDYPCDCDISDCPSSLEIINIGGTATVYDYNATPGEPPVPIYSTPIAPINIDCDNSALIGDCSIYSESTSNQALQLDGNNLWFKIFGFTDAVALTLSSIYNQTDTLTFTVNLYYSSDGFCTSIAGHTRGK